MLHYASAARFGPEHIHMISVTRPTENTAYTYVGKREEMVSKLRPVLAWFGLLRQVHE